MRRSLLSVAMVILTVLTFAQAPNLLNYQAVVRGSDGSLIQEETVSLRFSVLIGSPAGASAYVETHSVATNTYGLVNVQIGNGTPVSGDLSTVDWTTGAYYLKVDLDANGGSTFTEMGTQQLVTVPYAMHANTVSNSDNDVNNELQTISASGSDVTLSDGGGTVSINDADADPNNEIQSISKAGTDVTLSDGGGTVSIADNDNDATNEIQTLNKAGNDITLSGGGGTVSVADNDNDATNEIQTLNKAGNDITLSGGGGTVSVADNDNDATNEIQTISAAGGSLTLNNGGGSVDLEDLNVWKAATGGIHYSAGVVGVGTNTPKANLVVAGDSAIMSIGKAGTTFNDPNSGILRFTETADHSTSSFCGFEFQHNGSTNKLLLRAGCPSITDTIITFTRNGRVGIGTYSPLYDLEVGGTFGMADQLNHSGDNDTYLKFLTDGVDMYAGNERMFRMLEGGTDIVMLGDGGDVNINLNNDLFVDAGKNSTGIGTTTPSSLYSLTVASSKGGILTDLSTSSASTTYGHKIELDRTGSNGGLVYGQYTDLNKSNTSTSTVYGNFVDIDNTGNGFTYGAYIDIDATGSSNVSSMMAVRSDAYKSGALNASVYASYNWAQNYQTGTGTRYTYGVYGRATTNSTNGTAVHYGIYGTQSGSGDIEYAGYFSGNVYCSGSYLPSDAALKTNVNAHRSSLDKILALKIYDYEYKADYYSHMNLPEGQQTGFLASEFGQVFPALVTQAHQPPYSEEEIAQMEENGEMVPDASRTAIDFDAVNYAGLVPHLTKAIQEQQAMIEDLKAEVEALKTEMNDLKTN